MSFLALFKGLSHAPFQYRQSSGAFALAAREASGLLRWPAVRSEARLGCSGLDLPSILVASGARLARKATLCGPRWSAASTRSPT